MSIQDYLRALRERWLVVLTGIAACAYVLRPNQRRRRVANPTRAPERRRP